jgi:hypothetical protein
MLFSKHSGVSNPKKWALYQKPQSNTKDYQIKLRTVLIIRNIVSKFRMRIKSGNMLCRLMKLEQVMRWDFVSYEWDYL